MYFSFNFGLYSIQLGIDHKEQGCGWGVVGGGVLYNGQNPLSNTEVIC